MIDPPIGVAPIASNGRGMHGVTLIAQMRGDLVPARAVMPGAVDEHECQHEKIAGENPSPHQGRNALVLPPERPLACKPPDRLLGDA